MSKSVQDSVQEVEHTEVGKKRLGLWLRLITCSTMVEKEIRHLFREEYGITLPRFDLMAALERAPEGLSMGELSKRLLVSNGNVTGIVERLHKEGLVIRRAKASDRRSFHVCLSAKGQAVFKEMASSHALWIEDILGSIEDVDGLSQHLDQLKDDLKSRRKEGTAP